MHGSGGYLGIILVFLVAAVVAVPLFRRLGLGAILGYLAAGVAIGPEGLALVPDPEDVLAASEFGVVMLLFIIGLELSPPRLWVMRRQVFGTGGLQVLVSAAAIGLVAATFVILLGSMATLLAKRPPSPQDRAHPLRTAMMIPLLEDAPAFTLTSPPRLRLPVLIAVPHAGRSYPPEVTERMRDMDLAQLRLEVRYGDRLGVAIARATGAALLVAHAPRALLDLNRSEDDIDWDMVEGGRPADILPAERGQRSNARARSGLGLVPRRLPGSGEIWRGRLTPAELAALNLRDGDMRAHGEAALQR